MTTQVVTVAGVGNSAAVLLNPNSVGPNPGIFLQPGAGATVSVEATADDPAGSPTWVTTGVAALTSATANVVAGLPFPARAVRLVQSVGGTTSTMKVVTTGP